ncbi:MAG: ABC transporter substrate-binding protein [Acidimicrobiia bacterium]|nr:ABC transporter substrate-binding protein [Acidimicrobiia bacterium]
MTRRITVRFVALLAVLALVAAACADDTSGETTTTSTTAAPSGGDTTATTAPPSGGGGGEAVFIAEQWPECLNPIQSCANASWLQWMSSTHIMARLMELDADGNFVASPILTEAPSVDNGGLVENADGSFVITYNIRDDAVWSDGTPMTSADVEFTWRAYNDTVGVLSSAGYDIITSVDTSDPQVAVVTFSEIYAPWADLFGGGTNYLLPAHAFASTDIADDWIDEVTISGGPWLLQSFSVSEAVLVPNDNYWDADRKPLLDQVTFVPREDTDTEVIALQTGEGLVAYPQPFGDIKERLTDPIAFQTHDSLFYEGLWPGQRAPNSGDLLSNFAVRQAVIYSLDRQQIANTALGAVYEGDVPVLNCGGWTPAQGDACDGTDFAGYTQDFDKVEEILTADGWTRGDTCWEKDGRQLDIEWNTVAGNQRREDVQALVQQMTAPAGICWTIQNYDAGELFENRLPQLTFNLGLWAQASSPDPSQVALYNIDDIPSEENSFSGQNYTAWDNDPQAQVLSDLVIEADRTIDPVKRIELLNQAGDIVAENVVWIPLYTLPNITAYRTDLIEGPVGLFGASTYGTFHNMYDWSLIG